MKVIFSKSDRETDTNEEIMKESDYYAQQGFSLYDNCDLLTGKSAKSFN